MSERKLLKCEKCGKPMGYITVRPRSLLESRPDFDNVQVTGSCLECQGKTGFYQRNF